MRGLPAWSIAKEPFERWWKALHPDDAQVFIELGGDEELARFVFAYEYLTTQGNVSPLTARTDAFAAAASLSTYDASLPGRTETAWNHPAVTELLTLFHERARREIARRVGTKYAALLETMVDDAQKPDVALKEKVATADAVVKWLKLVSIEEQGDKRLREKRAGERRGLHAANPRADGNVSHDAQLSGFVRMIAEKYPEQLAALKGDTDET